MLQHTHAQTFHYAFYIKHNGSFIKAMVSSALASRRKRGLSGMKMSPTSAARAGNMHTRINTRQVWTWNSLPMLKPQPAVQHNTTQGLHFL